MPSQPIDLSLPLKEEIEATAKRVAHYPIVLAVHGRTELKYSFPVSIEEPDDELFDLVIHDTLAFSCEGTPLGIVDAEGRWHTAPGSKMKSNPWQKRLEAVARLQKDCTDTMVLNVTERHDVYDLLEWTNEKAERAHLLVRALSPGKLQPQKQIREHLLDLPYAGTATMTLPPQHNRPAYTFNVYLRYDQVTVQPPPRHTQQKSIQANAIHAIEMNPRSRSRPSEWLLLTTRPLDSFEAAGECIEWYVEGFLTDAFHRALKLGCNTDAPRPEENGELESLLAGDMATAWRVFTLTQLRHEVPDAPASRILEGLQWKLLVHYVNNTPAFPEEPPTIRQAARMLGRMGGFMGRKNDDPGVQTIWYGLQRLDQLLLGFNLARQAQTE